MDPIANSIQFFKAYFLNEPIENSSHKYLKLESGNKRHLSALDDEQIFRFKLTDQLYCPSFISLNLMIKPENSRCVTRSCEWDFDSVNSINNLCSTIEVNVNPDSSLFPLEIRDAMFR